MAGAHIAPSFIHNCVLFLFLLVLHFQMQHASQDSSLLFSNELQRSNFSSAIVLYGDARVVENSSMVELTKPMENSSGQVMYKDGLRFGKQDGFSTYFTFSVSAIGGGSLIFLVAPLGFNSYEFDRNPAGFSVESGTNQSFVAVEFDVTQTSKCVGIDVGRFISMKSRKFSFTEGKLNGGKKLHSWVDYQPSYKKLEVRISDSGISKPLAPLISFPLDLNQMWANQTMALSLSSYNHKSSQSCILHSWAVNTITNSHSIHSQPYDPDKKLIHETPRIITKEKYCFLRLFGALIFGIACGALGALMVLYLWRITGRRRGVVPLAPEDCSTSISISPAAFQYKKMKLLVDKPLEKSCMV